jgi:hypothetical protein
MAAKPLKQLADLIDQVEVKIEAGQATSNYVDEVQRKLNDMPSSGEETGRYYQYALELQALIYDAAGKEEEMVRSLEAAVEQAGSPRKLRSYLLKTYIRKHSNGDSENEPEIQKGLGDIAVLTPREQQFMRSYGMEGTPEVGFLVRKPTVLLVLMILSGGLYGTYWAYKNWQAIRDDTGSKISPFWRTVFLVFYVWPLFKMMTLLAKSRGYTVKYSGGLLAFLYIFLPVVALPVYYVSNSFMLVTAVEAITSCLSICVLVLAQQPAIYAVSKQPSTKPDYRPINYVELIFVVIGFLVLLNDISVHIKQSSQPYQSGQIQINRNQE